MIVYGEVNEQTIQHTHTHTRLPTHITVGSHIHRETARDRVLVQSCNVSTPLDSKRCELETKWVGVTVSNVRIDSLNSMARKQSDTANPLSLSRSE